MKITADHAFHIGSQHLRGGMPCQDYALSHAGADNTFAIVSDGCSSGGRTDVGARIVAHSTAIALAVVPKMEKPVSKLFESDDLSFACRWADYRAIDFACRWSDLRARETLDLKREDMLATCAYIVTGGDAATSRIVGDGVMAGLDRAGRLFMNRIDWAQNMPVYRTYEGDRYRSFIAAHGGRRAKAVTQYVHVRPGVQEDRTEQNTVEDGINGISIDHDPSKYKFLAVFSDGVTQVDGMDWRDVVAELMAFKSIEGDFVKRRMNRFLKDCLKHGKGPIDDISMACIHIDHEVQ